MENKHSNLVLEERKRLTLSGVGAVDSFGEEKIRLTTSLGRLTISGTKLKIVSFSESTGAFVCEGTVDGMVYSARKEGILKRIFK